MEIKKIFFDNGKPLHVNYNDHGVIECPVCSSQIEVYWEPKYNGIRGRCSKCGTNWAES